MGPKWEALTVTPHLLCIVQPELMIWSYVDTKLRMIHWMYWTICISRILLMATILIRLLSK